MRTWIGIIFAIVAIILTFYKKNNSMVFFIGLIAALIGFIGWAFLGWTF